MFQVVFDKVILDNENGSGGEEMPIVPGAIPPIDISDDDYDFADVLQLNDPELHALLNPPSPPARTKQKDQCSEIYPIHFRKQK